MNCVVTKTPVYPNLEVELVLAGWTYSKFAEFLGLSPMLVSNRMRGETEFKLEEMRNTAKFFNKSIEELFLKSNVKE